MVNFSDETLSWNISENVCDLFIYTDLSVDKLIEYFGVYRTDVIKIDSEPDSEEGYYFASGRTDESKSGFPSYTLDKAVSENHQSIDKFDFEPLSVLVTDDVFKYSVKHLMDKRDLRELYEDEWFDRIKELTSYLREDKIPHIIVTEIIRRWDDFSTEHLIGGYDSKGELYIHPLSQDFVYTRLLK
jgi:hypothetical protein